MPCLYWAVRRATLRRRQAQTSSINAWGLPRRHGLGNAALARKRAREAVKKAD